VHRGTKLSVAYFDQFREALDEDATLGETISQERDHVECERREKARDRLPRGFSLPARARPGAGEIALRGDSSRSSVSMSDVGRASSSTSNVGGAG